MPLLFRGRAVGALVALDRETDGGDFDEEDLRLLQAFAASAATAVATAQTVRVRAPAAAGRDRRARAPPLGAGAARRHPAGAGGDPDLAGRGAAEPERATRERRSRRAAEETVDRLESQISELSRLINDLRPAALERLGLVGALEALAEESAARGGFAVGDRRSSCPPSWRARRSAPSTGSPRRRSTTCVKHAGAARVSRLRGAPARTRSQIVVEDDGGGFDPTAGGERRPRPARDARAGRDARRRARRSLGARRGDAGARPPGVPAALARRAPRRALSRAARLDHAVGDREADQLGARARRPASRAAWRG